jgi:hypothetical protein
MGGHEREMVWTLGVAVAALVWLALLFRFTPLTSTNEGLDIDGVWYAAIAREPWRLLVESKSRDLRPEALGTDPSHWSIDQLTHWAPFCWRPLTPLLVRATGSPGVAGFLQIDFVGQWLAAILLWALLRRLSIPPGLSAAGVILYLTSFWGPRFAFWSPCHTETVTMVLELAILLAIVAGKPWITAILFLLGSLQREQLLTLALFQALWLWVNGGRPLPLALALAALIVLPGTVVQAAMRGLIHPLNSHHLLATIAFYSGQRWSHVVESRGLYIVRFVAGTLHSLGAVPFLILLGGPALWRALRRDAPWLLMALATWVLVWTGGVDNERRSFYVFPMLLAPLLLRWRESPLARATWPVLLWAFMGHVVVNLVFIDLSSPEMYGRTAISVFLPHADLPGYLARLGAVWAMTLIGGATILWQGGSRREPPEVSPTSSPDPPPSP